MKRIISVLLSCSIIASPLSTYAENLSDPLYISAKGTDSTIESYTNALVDGKQVSLRNVGVSFNESSLPTSFPAVIYDSRTMVPLRDIAEAMGAEVSWENESGEKGVAIKSKDKTIYLEIDSNYVLINGIKKKINHGVPPKLIGKQGDVYSYTMVPLRFISEEIGGSVDWNQEKFQAEVVYPQLGIDRNHVELSDIKSSDLNSKQLSSVSISLSSESAPKVYVPAENPNKIVMDIPNGKIKIGGVERKYFESHISKFPVSSVTASQLDDKNVRVTINLSAKTSFEPVFDGNNVSVVFPEISVNSLGNITLENINGREAIVLHNSSTTEYKAFTMSGRVVVDMLDTSLNTSSSVSSSSVARVRASQYENPKEYSSGTLVTRVVLDLKSDVSKFSYTAERIGNNLALFVKNETPTAPEPSLPEEPQTPGTGGSGDQDNGAAVTYTQYNATISDMVKAQSSRLNVTDKYRNEPGFVHSSQLQTINGMVGTVTSDTAQVRSQMDAMSFVYGTLKKGSIVSILGEENGWYRIQYTATWRNAKPEDIRYYLDPGNFPMNTAGSFQFLDLSRSSGISDVELDRSVLVNKGILSGKGNSFIEAGKTYGVNEIYLVSHAFLETGNGSSSLAKGVLVSTVDGKPVEPKTVYNMFGIGAVDSNPLKLGAEKAYKEGWFTPEQAIVGGAKFISEGYISKGQNTLYEMKWHPDINKIWHQYATDIGWAYKQVNNMKKLYDLCSGYTLKYDIPVYKK